MSHKKIHFFTTFLLVAGCSVLPPTKTLRYDESTSNIVVLNGKEYSRSQIAEGLMDLQTKSPRVVGVDFGFYSKKGHYEDSLLRDALNSYKDHNIVIGYTVRDSIDWRVVVPILPHAYFLSPVVQYGYFKCLVDGENRHQVQYCEVAGNEGKDVLYSMPYLVSYLYDSAMAKSYINKYKGAGLKKDKIMLKKTGDEYPTYDLMDVKNLPDKVFEGKIVLIGYTGPTDEDKKRTTLRYKMDAPDSLDTYGVYIIANDIEQILRGELGTKARLLNTE